MVIKVGQPTTSSSPPIFSFLRVLVLELLYVGLASPWRMYHTDFSGPAPLFGFRHVIDNIDFISVLDYYLKTFDFPWTWYISVILRFIGTVFMLFAIFLTLIQILKKNTLNVSRWLWLPAVVALFAGLFLLEERCFDYPVLPLSFYSCLLPGYNVTAVAIVLLIFTEATELGLRYLIEWPVNTKSAEEVKTEQMLITSGFLAVWNSFQIILWCLNDKIVPNFISEGDVCSHYLIGASMFCYFIAPIISKGCLGFAGVLFGLMTLKNLNNSRQYRIARLCLWLNVTAMLVFVIRAASQLLFGLMFNVLPFY